MSDYAELEIRLRRGDASAPYRVEGMLRLPGDSRNFQAGPYIASFDLAALRALEADPHAYGLSLWQQLFADPTIQEFVAAARARASSAGRMLRFRLDIERGAPELHALRWETLVHPARSGAFLATDENVLFSRYLSGPDTARYHRSPAGGLRALVAIADPLDREQWGLGPVDAAGELARVGEALAGVQVTWLCGPAGGECEGRPTLSRIVDRLHEGYDILYLVAHGRLRDGVPVVYLEKGDGNADPVPGVSHGGRDGLADCLRQLPRAPMLAVLASCRSAGGGDDDMLIALGPALVEAGVPAVIAMQGDISTQTVAAFVPAFLSELRRDGQIDRAAAAARRQARDRLDWWMPALFTCLSEVALGEAQLPAARKGALAGVIFAVIVALILAVSSLIQPIDGPTPTPTPMRYVVRVERQNSAGTGIKDAEVMLVVSGRPPLDAFTDNIGVAVIEVRGPYVGALAEMTVVAPGFAPFRQNITLDAGMLPPLVQLSPLQQP